MLRHKLKETYAVFSFDRPPPSVLTASEAMGLGNLVGGEKARCFSAVQNVVHGPHRRLVRRSDTSGFGG